MRLAASSFEDAYERILANALQLCGRILGVRCGPGENMDEVAAFAYGVEEAAPHGQRIAREEPPCGQVDSAREHSLLRACSSVSSQSDASSLCCSSAIAHALAARASETNTSWARLSQRGLP